jgi:CubicO group peptidase (beta-lactamase class C family)
MSIDELCGRAQQLVDDGVSPACQLAVARDGELLAFETFGAATNERRFCFYSATKPIVASMMWLLIGDGLLAPDHKVVDHVPEFATNGKDVVTIEQVMLHTAGFPNAPLDAVRGADPTARRAAFERWRLEWEPGSQFEYHAASAHWVLVDLIERATGLDFRDAIEQRICAPLGLPRLLGIPIEQQGDIVEGVRIGDPTEETVHMLAVAIDPEVRAAGVPGGGGIMSAATMARWYQALLRNPADLWDDAVLRDAKTRVRCTFDEPLMHVPVNRTLGLVLAGDDGLHQLRYAAFGKDCSPGAFGHAGAFLQVAWADPATGTSFAFCKNGYNADMLGDAGHVIALCDLAAALS